ncbi:hypothetical protein SM033_00113 [Vibrio phage vB_VpaM_sm033]|nr:hypothetical protein SM033_00113 [Vibrio phage vB_VpaM_sm033]
MIDVFVITLSVLVGIVLGWYVRPARKERDEDMEILDSLLISYLWTMRSKYGCAYSILKALNEDAYGLSPDNRKRLQLLIAKLDATKSNHL